MRLLNPIFIAFICYVGLTACGSRIADPGTDSTTQFWKLCQSSSECGGLGCICGRCSKECAAPAECGMFAANAECAELDLACGSTVSVCVPAQAIEGPAPDAAPDSEGVGLRTVAILAAPLIPPPSSAAPAGRHQLDAEDAVLACEQPPASELTRSACPEQPPAVDACSTEGLECRYSSTETCAAVHVCAFGLWTLAGEECEGPAEEPTLLAGNAPCPEGAPIPDALCEQEGQSCGYMPCTIGGDSSNVYDCTCGRWFPNKKDCPVD